MQVGEIALLAIGRLTEHSLAQTCKYLVLLLEACPRWLAIAAKVPSRIGCSRYLEERSLRIT